MAVQLGRVVHYRIGTENGRPVYRPGTVVQVWDAEGGCVNLKVDLDGTHDLNVRNAYGMAVNEDEANRCTAWRTSVLPGDGENQWIWPPRG